MINQEIPDSPQELPDFPEETPSVPDSYEPDSPTTPESEPSQQPEPNSD